MDYTELVHAIQNGDDAKANKMCAEAHPILIKYLIANMGASQEDAEDAVQKMFEFLIPKIQKDQIQRPGGLLSYMLMGCRHAFLKNIRDLNINDQEPLEDDPSVDATQIWNLVNEERASILKKCIESLKSHYKDMVQFLFQYPEADASDIAEKFDISINNAWIRKHRVIKQLSDCAQSNS